MCIDDNVFGLTDNYPKFGEIVTVLGECKVYSDCWMVENYLYDSRGRLQAFLKSRFVPLSEIDERQLAEQRLITA